MSGSEKVNANIDRWVQLKKAGLQGIGQIASANMQNSARSEARWKDQTGNARQGLHGGSFWQNPFCLIVYIAHAMEYGIFLELANDGRYAILEQTRDSFASEVINNAKRIISQ